MSEIQTRRFNGPLILGKSFCVAFTTCLFNICISNGSIGSINIRIGMPTEEVAKNDLKEGAKMTPSMAPSMIPSMIPSLTPSMAPSMAQNVQTYHMKCNSWACLEERFKTFGDDELYFELINPFTPVHISDYYNEDEITNKMKKPPEYYSRLNGTAIELNDVDCGDIPYKSTVFIQSDRFKNFVELCLPHLKHPIILLTGKWHLPMLHKSDLTDFVLNHNNILHWFAQNPIYAESSKYTHMPYGILHRQLKCYADAVLRNKNKKKSGEVIINMKLGPTHPDRKEFLGVKPMPADEFYDTVARAQFIISPRGDRPDCYRHWESIGLGTVPICNCPEIFKELFNSSALVTTKEKMIYYLRNSTEELEGFEFRINKNLLSVGYWMDRIKMVQATSS